MVPPTGIPAEPHRLAAPAIAIALVVAIAWLRSDRPGAPTAVAGSDSAVGADGRRGDLGSASIGSNAQVDAPRTEVPTSSDAPGVQVSVLDPDDAPVPGVAVALTARLRGDGTSTGDLARAETDREGRATLFADPDELARLERLGLSLAFDVVAAVPLPDQPTAELDGDPRSATPVVLRVAAFGSAEVSVSAPMGAAVDDGGPVFLFWRAIGSDSRWERTGTPRSSSEGGVARFAIVPLDRELLFRATGAGRFEWAETAVTGPARAGEHVRATIRLGPELPFVVGRLVDETGTPLAAQGVTIGVGTIPRNAPADATPGRGDASYRQCTTDAFGGFRIRVTTRATADERRVLMVEQQASSDAGEVCRRAMIPLDSGLRGGFDNDVGTIAIVPEGPVRLLVAGRVRDEHGAALAGADVAAGHWARPEFEWRRLQRSTVRSGPDGRFEIRTSTELPPSFQVSASARGRVSATTEAAPGTTGVELVLRRGGTLRAWVRAPAGVPPHFLVGRIDGREPSQLGGGFGYDNLPPGRHDVTVHIRGTPWEVGRVDDVLVPEGGAADDPRVTGLEVDCRPLQLILLDVAGQRLAEARIAFEDRAGHGGQATTDADGRALLVIPSTADTLELRGPDGARAQIRCGAGEQTVRLLPR